MSKATHSFSVEIAALEGLVEAILLQHIHFLQTSFLERGQSECDVWVKRSVRALHITYPYLTDRQIRNALDRLEEREVIVSDKTAGYDRTKAYQLSEKGWIYFKSLPFDKKANAFDETANRFDKKANPFVQNGKSYIGSYNPVINSYNSVVEETREEEKSSTVEAKPLYVESESTPAAPAQNAAPFADFDIDRAAASLIDDYKCVELFRKEFGCDEAKANEKHPIAVAEFVEKQKAVMTVYHNDRDFRQHYFSWLPKVRAARKAEAQNSQAWQAPKSGAQPGPQYRRLTA